jgi:hypothetical protein
VNGSKYLPGAYFGLASAKCLFKRSIGKCQSPEVKSFSPSLALMATQQGELQCCTSAGLGGHPGQKAVLWPWTQELLAIDW